MTNASLTADLRAERAARQLAEDALANLLLKNFTLVEYNKLLISKDNALQNDISSLISKPASDNWTRLALENRMRSAPSARTFGKDVANLCHSSISVTPHMHELPADSPLRKQGATGLSESIFTTSDSSQTSLRAQLVVVQDELHITKRQLAVTEQRRHNLSAKVTFLQEHITTCVDECGAALEVERELRYELEDRVHELLCETMVLKGQAKVIEGGVDRQKTFIGRGALQEADKQANQPSGATVAVFERCNTLEKENLKQNDLVRELSEKIINHEDLQTEATKLKGDVTRYKKIVTALQMKEKERTVDMRLKAKAGQVRNLFSGFVLFYLMASAAETRAKGTEENGYERPYIRRMDTSIAMCY